MLAFKLPLVSSLLTFVEKTCEHMPNHGIYPSSLSSLSALSVEIFPYEITIYIDVQTHSGFLFADRLDTLYNANTDLR
ncbi:hypothetical protein BJY04DRAFT_94752 [Aspergillus karnatakaensis]|uniref:uncharacterized protein n=1 Tax=Aspergillus karnatakaensis TaxID=1810916 RepID=UPI003CCE3327